MSPQAPREYDFTLVLLGESELTNELEGALLASGCDDATLSRQGGRTLLDFTRAAPSLAEAVASALSDVRRGGLSAEVEWPGADGEALTEPQRAELERRLAASIADPGAGTPWEVVKAQVFKRAGQETSPPVPLSAPERGTGGEVSSPPGPLNPPPHLPLAPPA